MTQLPPTERAAIVNTITGVPYSDALSFLRVDLLEDEVEEFRYVKDGFARGQQLGYFPAYRKGPEGTESAAIAKLAGERVGFVTYFFVDNTYRVWIDLVFVEAAYRKQGIGTQLLRAVEAFTWVAGEEIRYQFGTGLQNRAMQALAGVAGFESDSINFSRVVRRPA